ncbi:CDGSH iron-sulfur domain-containing protein [Solirhodobacter olei]|uniref:CDGSH iron-sulfur domain-containing protein n=1 Tax=Solirhodobacter olei TaxID=2493082 RepID=UPI000FD76394|nr:CDGSH iron-sulfur domain-containing protein [Solirhodobacter olei]
MVEIIKGDKVTVQFDASLCVHSRNCVLSHPEVFVPNVKGDWIFPDAASPDAVMRIGFNCPSGAISVTTNVGADSSEAPPTVNTIRVRENGPLGIEGELLLRGTSMGRARATLCRCGKSQNKPFCDGSHVAAGFSATGEPMSKEAPTLERRDGPVDLQPQPNGPLKIVGNLEVVSGTGRTVNKVRQAFFCRCGASRNKPYCDGSHKTENFSAD